jgi:hypothetical protein
MTVLVNGVAVSPSHGESMEIAVRELLHQRAVPRGSSMLLRWTAAKSVQQLNLFCNGR